MATTDVFNPAREVQNQAPPLEPLNLFDADLALQEALVREGGEWGIDQARETGAVAGSAEAREHRFRNVLWKYLGTKEVGEGPEVKAVAIQPGDKFVLCTDGLSGVVSDDKIMSCVEENADVQKCADALGQLALDSGSRDNVSCIVIEVTEG